MMTFEIEIINKLGLHARAATKLAATAKRFQATILVGRNDQHMVNCKSIMGIMMLAASQGVKLLFSIDGADAQEAAKSIQAIIAHRFGEDA